MLRSQLTAFAVASGAWFLPGCRSESSLSRIESEGSPPLSIELPTADSNWARETSAQFAELVEGQRLARIRELGQARDDDLARTLARHAALVEVGGYAKKLQQRLAHVEDTLPGASESERLQLLNLKDSMQLELDRLRCARPEIFMVETGSSALEVHPGTYLILTGCRFGLREGNVALRLTDPSQELALTVRNWDDDTILVEVPDLTGVADQDATLQITSFQGETSNESKVRFIASREVLVVFGPYMHCSTNVHHLETVFGVPYMTCAVSPVGSAQKHWTNATSLVGYHRQWGDLYAASGRDVIGLNLLHGWKLVEYRLDVEAGSALAPEDGRITSYDCLVLDRPNIPPDEQWITFRLYWWVDSDNSSVRYELAALIEGPRGVPYANVVQTSAMADLQARGKVPGAPCQ